MQSSLKNPIICPIKQHKGSQILWFKFSQNKDEILQCKFCIQDDDSSLHIILEQLINEDPVWEIKNFPPSKYESKIRQLLKNNQENYINQFKQENIQLIEKSYLEVKNGISQSLDKQQKQSLQELENQLMQIKEVENFFDIKPLKDNITKYSEGKITFENLFEFQLKMKKLYECEDQIDKIISAKKKISIQIQDLNEYEKDSNIEINKLNDEIKTQNYKLNELQKTSDILNQEYATITNNNQKIIKEFENKEQNYKQRNIDEQNQIKILTSQLQDLEKDTDYNSKQLLSQQYKEEFLEGQIEQIKLNYVNLTYEQQLEKMEIVKKKLDQCENAENSEQMIIWLQFLTEIYQKLGLFQESLNNLEKCKEIYEYQLKNTQNLIEQSKVLFNQSLFFEQFADIYSDLKNYEQSITYLNQSRQYWVNQDPDILNFNHQRIISNLGEIYALTGNIDKSVQFLTLVKQKMELQKLDQYNTQIYLKNCLLLGKIEANQGNYKESEEITLNCYKISQNRQDKKIDYKLKVEIIEHLATTYNFLQNMEQFKKYIEIGFQVIKEAGIQNQSINIRFYQLQGFLYFRQGNYQQAIESGTNLKKIAENKFGQNCYQAVDGYMIIGLSQFAQGYYEKNQLKKEEGLNNLEMSVQISEQNCEKKIEILSDLAKCYLKNRQYKQSVDSAEKIQKIKHDNLVEQNLDLQQLELKKIQIDLEFNEFKTEVEKQEKINKSWWGFLF